VHGWLLARAERALLAERLLADTIANQHVDRGQLTIHADSEYVEAGAPGLPDPHSDGRKDAGAGTLPGFLTHTPTDMRLALSFLGSVGGLGAPGEAPASSTV
jgi:hypothetical protein